MALCLEHSVMYKALTERRIAGMEREQNSLMDQIDKIHGVRSGARYPPRPTPVVISGGITLNKVHVEQGDKFGKDLLQSIYKETGFDASQRLAKGS